MRSWLAVAVFLVACKGSEDKPKVDPDPMTPVGASDGDDSFAKGLASLEDIRMRMCACSDVPCTDKVFEEFKAWRVNMRKDNPGKRPSPAQEQKGNAIDKAMRACRSNVTAKPGSAAGSAAPNDPLEAALVEHASFRSKMCACQDKACADAVQTDFATWQRNLRAKVPAKFDKQQEARAAILDGEMTACRKKAETGTPGAAGGAAKIDAMLVKVQSFRNKICACTSKDCATKAIAEMKTWMGQAATEVADAKPNPDQDAKAVRLNTEIKACVAKHP